MKTDFGLYPVETWKYCVGRPVTVGTVPNYLRIQIYQRYSFDKLQGVEEI